MNDGKTTTKPGGANPTLVLAIIYAYMLILNFALPVIVFIMFSPTEGEALSFAVSDLLPPDLTSPVHLMVYGLGLICFVSGFLLPKIIGGKGSSMVVSIMSGGQVDERNKVAQATAPYIIRLVLFETTTICGFIAAFLAENPPYIIPLGALGLLGALLSPPTPGFIKTLTE
jgi:hypothetical protein